MRLIPGLILLLAASTALAQPAFEFAGGPWRDDRVLLGRPDGRAYMMAGDRLAVSQDGGLTWALRPAGPALLGLAADGPALIGATAAGVVRSEDDGLSWAPWGLEGQTVRRVQSEAGVGYAMTDTTLNRRVAGAWESIPIPAVASAKYGMFDVGPAGGIVLAEYVYPVYSNGAFIWTSRDDGTTWTRLGNLSALTGLAFDGQGTLWATTVTNESYFGTIAGGVYRMGATEEAFTRIASGNAGGVRRFADGSIGYGLGGRIVVHDDSTVLEIPTGASVVGAPVDTGIRVLAGTASAHPYCYDPPCGWVGPSGAYAVVDGRVVQVGARPSAVRALHLDSDGQLLAGAESAVFRTEGGAWVNTGANLPAVVTLAALPWDSTTVLATGGTMGTYPTVAWIPGGVGEYDFLYYLSGEVSTVAGASRLVLSLAGMYGSGGLFSLASTDNLPELVLDHQNLRTLGVVDSAVIYAGARSGEHDDHRYDAPALVYRSDDDGQTWTADDAGLTASETYAFAALGTESGRRDFVATDVGVFARTGGGDWAPAGLNDRPVLALGATPGDLLAGTDDGLFLRTDHGTWAPYGSGLDGRTVYAILTAEDDDGTWLAVGTDAGVYATRRLVTVDTEANAPEPAPSLSVSVLPNPASGPRTIRIEGLTSRTVHVRVFDLLGRLTADLGTFSSAVRLDVPWNAPCLPAGLYLIRVESARGEAVTRATVLR